MRNLFFVLLIILVSCQKDQLAPTENKLEEKAVVWDGTERKPTVTDETRRANRILLSAVLQRKRNNR
jgi:hypothetical protein